MVFCHNSFGDVITKRLPNGEETHYRYDKKHRLTHCDFLDKSQIIRRYDNEYNLTKYIDKAGLKTQFAYFGQGRLKQRKTPDGHTIEYHYDTEEQLIGVTNQRGETWQLNRDAAGRLKEEIDYWGKSIHYTYDAAGNLQSSTDPLGNLLHITCDKMGRITQKMPASGPDKIEEYHYNKHGQLTAAISGACRIQRTYNDEGNLLSESNRKAAASHRLITL